MFNKYLLISTLVCGLMSVSIGAPGKGTPGLGVRPGAGVGAAGPGMTHLPIIIGTNNF